MRLEVDSATISPQNTGGVSSAGLHGSNARAAGAYGSQRDSAQISNTSQLLNAASADRSARIQQLTAAVRAGTYNVPSTAISQALVGEAGSQGSGTRS